MGTPVMVPSVWTCEQPGPQRPWIMLSHSVREAAVAIYGFLSLSNTHIFTIRNKPGHEFNHKAPTGSILRNTLTGTTNSHFRICQTFTDNFYSQVDVPVLKKKKLNFVHCLWSLFVIYAIIHVEHVELDKAQQRPLLFIATTLSDNITFMLTLTPKAKQNIRK